MWAKSSLVILCFLKQSNDLCGQEGLAGLVLPNLQNPDLCGQTTGLGWAKNGPMVSLGCPSLAHLTVEAICTWRAVSRWL